MNIHPAFVHFPIAILFLYTLIELLPMQRIWAAVQWDGIRHFLLYIGTLSAVATAVTGLMAAQIYGITEAVQAHRAAAVVLVTLAIITSAVNYFWRSESAARPWILKAFALAIFLMLFTVGALGSNLVYGKDVDPIVSFVTRLFGL